MTQRYDLFAHVNESLNFSVQLLDEDGDPIDFEQYDIEIAFSLEPNLPSIDVIAYPGEIYPVDPGEGVIGVNYQLNSNTGYTGKDHFYQLRIEHKITNVSTIMLEGRLFIRDSIF